MPDGRGFAISSTEGRVGLDYFDEALSSSAKYAFKCHRKVEGGQDIVYPVNALCARARPAAVAPC
jgi:cell cycle arrest protein BUB3